MGFLRAVKDFIMGLFSRDPAEVHRRRELKRIHQFLATRHPPVYKASQKMVLPGFAELLLGYCRLLKSVADPVRRSIGNPDPRQSQKWFDLLIDTRLPEEQRERKAYFSYEGMRDRLQAAMDPEEELEVIAREFQSFMRALENPQVKAYDAELMDMERVAEICRHDYERLLGLFDPGVDVENSRYKPEFSAASGETVLPELVDFYYVTSGFAFSERMEDNLAVLLDRLAPPEVDRSAQRAKLSKVLAAINRVLKRELGQDLLLCLIRAIKADPAYTPDMGRSRGSYLESYRNRIFNQFQRDKERLRRERHEDAITRDVSALFPDGRVLEMEAYNEENSALLSRDSPESFAYVKPMRILKTFVVTVFEAGLKDQLKKILVEGYFDSKPFQNNMANVFFQCEHSLERLNLFEEGLLGNGRVSIVAMKRYLEEARRGKDIQDFLSKMVDGVNMKARDIVENETNLFNMLADSMAEIVADFKRPTPEVITNIRTLGGVKNKELISSIAAGQEKISRMVKVMRNFTVVRTGALVAPLPVNPQESVEHELEDLNEPQELGEAE